MWSSRHLDPIAERGSGAQERHSQSQSAVADEDAVSLSHDPSHDLSSTINSASGLKSGLSRAGGTPPSASASQPPSTGAIAAH
jgi:hypothetical protein